MNISVMIDDFIRKNIQSEAEVRSKLIVPLLELSDLEVEWVYKHSLLVFEAKKPTEKVLVKGQPVFYSAWTKSVAYMISNGINIEGYIVNANYSDTCVFSCRVEEIPEKWEEMLVKKVKRILALSNEAIQTITTNIIPVLSTIKLITRKIGMVHRKGKFSGVSYIRVEVWENEDTAPIIEFREDDIDTFPKLDSYYIDKLREIGKSESNVLESSSSMLHLYFRENVFHDHIYGEIKDLFKELLGNF